MVYPCGTLDTNTWWITPLGHGHHAGTDGSICSRKTLEQFQRAEWDGSGSWYTLQIWSVYMQCPSPDLDQPLWSNTVKFLQIWKWVVLYDYNIWVVLALYTLEFWCIIFSIIPDFSPCQIPLHVSKQIKDYKKKWHLQGHLLHKTFENLLLSCV